MEDVMIKKNVGNLDRIARIVLGVTMLGCGIYSGNWWGAIGIVLILTGIFSRCGLYTLFGITTCKIKKPE
jgi:hypothetical protein